MAAPGGCSKGSAIQLVCIILAVVYSTAVLWPACQRLAQACFPGANAHQSIWPLVGALSGGGRMVVAQATAVAIFAAKTHWQVGQLAAALLHCCAGAFVGLDKPEATAACQAALGLGWCTPCSACDDVVLA